MKLNNQRIDKDIVFTPKGKVYVLDETTDIETLLNRGEEFLRGVYKTSASFEIKQGLFKATLENLKELKAQGFNLCGTWQNRDFASDVPFREMSFEKMISLTTKKFGQRASGDTRGVMINKNELAFIHFHLDEWIEVIAYSSFEEENRRRKQEYDPNL